MVSKLVNGKWVRVTRPGSTLPNPKFRSDEEVNLITQKREWGVPFALKGQEFDISNWFNIDTAKKTWELKPEYDAQYDIVFNDDGQVVQIKHIPTQYISYKRRRDGRDPDIRYGNYITHDINWYDTGLLNEEFLRKTIEFRDDGDEDYYEYERRPYVTSHKKWWANDKQVKNAQALQFAKTWDTYSEDWEEKDGDEDWRTDRFVKPKTERTFTDEGIKQTDKYWDDYSYKYGNFDDERFDYEKYYLERDTTYDKFGRPIREVKRDDEEVDHLRS